MARPFSTIVAGDGGIFKICCKCDEAKALHNFGRHIGRIDGLSPMCKECVSKKSRAYYVSNTEKVKSSGDNWRKNNPLKRRDIVRRFRANNPGYDKRWIDDNAMARENRRLREKRARESPVERLNNAMSCGIRGSVARGSKRRTKWESLVGYDVGDLRRHLERLFLPGMTWSNYGRGGWHIDHKIPKALFNYRTPEDFDFGRCWALENLQPLWERDNLSKQDKYDGAFQPSLAMS
ncbi:hypothetical protein [Mesorhizobium sp. M00.F.Ca.ET.217.01.1.1]|uniref:hypothetical protein n=1 Tax=Mesorhizobium sp. M00.F.Ca.ET.217.01.1.1 TaxID=2500529 RepID=UPI000FDB2359|nr:hypothetical protein [Mesorhizobium sp. M00.F.Ca.ET.217.01.1.1]TGQ19346.1 hypothetical protein EN860_019655 [Mesorhizobium sp. M00.F.Ca.ET.217.01.1.1]